MAEYEESMQHLLEDRPGFVNQQQSESQSFSSPNEASHVISQPQSNMDNSELNVQLPHIDTEETVEIQFDNSGNGQVGSAVDGRGESSAVENNETMDEGSHDKEQVEDPPVGQSSLPQQEIQHTATPPAPQIPVQSSEREAFIFTCPFCLQRYKDAEELKTHLTTHMAVNTAGVDESKSGKAQHQCGECEKAFDTYEHLQSHLQVHRSKSKDSELFKCATCGKQFRTKYGLSNHANVHRLDKHQCNICKVYFMDEESLLAHSLEHSKVKKESHEDNDLVTVAIHAKVNTVEEDETSETLPEEDNADSMNYKYKCEYCGKLFRRKVLHTIHLRTHTGEKPFSCKYCSKAFARKYVLTYHERIHSGEKPHKCTECDKAFTTPTGLHAHNRVHTGQKPYCCLHCGRKFALRSSLRVHQAIHMVTKDFECEMCSKTFTVKKYLNRHLKKCPMVAKTRYKCDQCNEGFPTKTRLASHELTCVKATTDQVEHADTTAKSGRSLRSSSDDTVEKSAAKEDLQCKFCSKYFTKPCLLLRHERIHTGEKPFGCQYCPQRFVRKESVAQHERIHTGEKPYSCEYCDRSYRTAPSLKDHQKSHLRCSVCNKKFKNVEAAETHENTHKLAYTCVKCDERFRSKRLLDCHARTHKDNTITMYECKMCKEVFGTRASLTRHKMDSHEYEEQSWSQDCATDATVIKSELADTKETSDQSIDEQIASKEYQDTLDFYQCSHCGKKEASLFCLEKHERTHTKERPYSCGKCSRGFVRQDAQKLHESDCAFMGKLPCNFCNGTFKSEAALKSHQRSHERKGPISCQYCEQVFDTVDEVYQHERDHIRIKGEKSAHKYKCGFCGKTFQKDCRRIVHERSHTGEKPYSCSLCPKRFARKDTLKVHIWTHSNSKPFSCQLCDTTFKLKSNLNAHLKNMHNVDEEHACQECGKSFRSNKSLRVHNLLHSSSVVYSGSLKVYVCQHCEESFKRLRAFAKHLRKEHNEYRDGRSEDDDDEDNGDDDEKDSDFIPEEDGQSEDSKLDEGKTFYQCSVCNGKETSVYRLEAHERKHTEERPHTCQKCSKGFVRVEMQKIHETDCNWKQIQCEVCEKKFKNLAAYKMHKKSHEKKVHLCSVCGVVTSSSIELKEHRKTHTPDVLRNYYCTECPKSFTHKNSLANHIDTCHRDPTRPKCVHCGETFVNEGWLRQHMYVNHYDVLAEQQMRSQHQPNISSINVSIQQSHHQPAESDTVKAATGGFESLHLQSTMDCIETLAAFSSLQGDVMPQVAANKPDVQHATDILQVEFNTTQAAKQVDQRADFTGSDDKDGEGTYLQIGESQMVSTGADHETSKNEEDETTKPVKDVKKYPCKLCPRRFRKKSELRNHTRTHTGEKPFLCNQCGKRFKVVSGLKAHEDRHLGLKRYRCTECPKAYANPSGLREHMDAHKGIKRYQCMECPKSFRQRQSLKEHLDVHRGFRQFQCESCPRSFSQRRSWRIHMRTHGKLV